MGNWDSAGKKVPDSTVATKDSDIPTTAFCLRDPSVRCAVVIGTYPPHPCWICCSPSSG